MDEHLKKFTQEAERQAKVASDALEAEKLAQTLRKQDLRRIQINKLQRNAGFMEEWQAKGVEDWKKNQKKKKERELSELAFDYKQAQKFNETAIKKLSDAHAEVYEGIAKFEETLKATQGLKNLGSTDQSEASDRMAQTEKARSPFKSLGRTQGHDAAKAMTTAGGAFTLASTGLKQRTKKTMTEASRLARNKRRRRLIGQQEEAMTELEQSQREQMVVELMKRQAA